MSRKLCSICLKAESACICRFFHPVVNDIDIVMLQHPNEVKQSKGSAQLLQHSLQRYTVFVGENFSDHPELNRLLTDPTRSCHLLYPSEKAINVQHLFLSTQTVGPLGSQLNEKQKSLKQPTTLIVLDGTWKKSYKMYMLSQNLHHIAHVTLPKDIEGNYTIRHTNKAHALSTLEACLHALTILENQPEKYQPIFSCFEQFNQFQLSFSR